MLKTNADVVSVIIGLPNIFYILKVSSVPVGMVLNKNDDTSNSYPDIVQGGELSIKLGLFALSNKHVGLVPNICI